jgi:hypothetical protein
MDFNKALLKVTPANNQDVPLQTGGFQVEWQSAINFGGFSRRVAVGLAGLPPIPAGSQFTSLFVS